MSQVRQNFNEEAEAGINKQINIELRASYIYQSMVRIKKFYLKYELLKKLKTFKFKGILV